jgi:hypothetical protein
MARLVSVTWWRWLGFWVRAGEKIRICHRGFTTGGRRGAAEFAEDLGGGG